MAKASSRVLAEIYRQHHIPLPAITLEALVQRGPRTTTEVVAKLQGDPAALERWKEQNATVIVQSAQLLHREVPIRLARRIVDLENLPGGLPEAPSIVRLREGLISSFEQMISFPKPKDLEGERAYMELQAKIRAEHATMQTNLADALSELDGEPAGLAEILDGFYNSRIGIRMLVDQHVAAQNPVPGFAGIIADECSPVQIAHDVIAKVRPMWEENLPGRTLPEFRISGEASATYRYIPQHISLILSEAIKNAVVNSLHHAQAAAAGSAPPPPVDILVAGGSHGVCIKVSDRGGGMTRDQANALFSYVPSASASASASASTSRAATATAGAAGAAYDPVSAALERRASGIDFQKSFGLRIAALHAQYFGGALSLMPMEGHGVDAYIYMNCLTEASQLK